MLVIITFAEQELGRRALEIDIQTIEDAGDCYRVTLVDGAQIEWKKNKVQAIVIA